MDVKPIAELLNDPVLDYKLYEVVDALIDHVSNLDDDETDRRGLIKLILMALSKAEIKYGVDTMMALPGVVDVYDLYKEISDGITGRFAMWYKDAEAVYKIASMPGNYLEIGTAHGGSAVMAGIAKRLTKHDGKIYCVDPLQNTHQEVLGNLRKYAVWGVTNIIRKMTPPIPEELDGLEFSAVLIDADHTWKFPENDWLGVKDKVINGGYVMFHDIHRKACYAAFKIAYETPGWEMVAEYCNIGHGFSTIDRTMGTYGVVRKL